MKVTNGVTSSSCSCIISFLVYFDDNFLYASYGCIRQCAFVSVVCVCHSLQNYYSLFLFVVIVLIVITKVLI